MEKGMLVILSGPSGSGKGTVLKKFLADENFGLSISATTREPRLEDKEGVTYFFKTKEEFESMINNGEFIEYAQYNGNYYGTPKQFVLDSLNNGKDMLVEVEVQGAMQLKGIFHDAVYIFMTTPDINILKSRLIGRGSETPQRIQERLDKALYEIEYLNCYDYLIVNDDLDKAVEDLKSAVNDAKAKRKANSDFIKNFKGEIEKC